MRKIFVGYPVKGQFSVQQTRNMIDISRTRFPDCEIKLRILEGVPINQARSEFVQNAYDEGCSDIVMIDADLGVGPKELGRILTHDEEVVCALYCHRSLNCLWHVQPTNPPSEERSDGLLKVKQSAVGFSKIKLSVFDKLKVANPDRVGQLTERTGGNRLVWEFFPFELVGQNTPASRIKDLLSLSDEFLKIANEQHEARLDARFVASRIKDLATTNYLADNYHVSEDFNFCRLCSESGIPIYTDTQLIVQHKTEVDLPIPTAHLAELMREGWRQAELDQLNGSNN